MNAMQGTTEKRTDTLLLSEHAADEQIIERGIDAFVEVGNALRRIRDRRSYIYQYGTFEEYCHHRWKLTKSYANNLIAASTAAGNLTTIVVKPTHETQLRPLTTLKPEQQREVWKEAVDTSKNGRPTQKEVAAIVQKHKAQLPVLREPAKQSDYITLAAWNALHPDLRLPGGTIDLMAHGSTKSFNGQENTSIEWAQWSWNPVTGCLHNCPYCYARDIANRFYAQKFEPVILPDRLNAPINTNVPSKASEDISFKNVFVCSMADLFGRWVPALWIEAVLERVFDAPQWNFLFLTKFPQRMSEFEYPSNAWLGTSVDCQARVKNAERAFSKIKCRTKWLSVEPMLEPLKFSRLDLFQWIVIGGASDSAAIDGTPVTPEWTPPLDWIVDLHTQARAAGCRIYYKDNCGFGKDSALRIREFPWSDPPLKELPNVFRYLKQANNENEKPE